MLYYPQLLSGAVAQFPIARVEAHRTVVNTMPDGSTVRSADPGFGSARWQLSYSHLTDAEAGALRELFEAAQGELNSFVFLDPADNLLLWSSDLTNAAWSTDALLRVTGGQADPQGGTGAFQLTNTGQAGQGIRQTIPAPGSLLYCFSLYALSAGGTALTLTASDSAEEASITVNPGTGWSRYAFASMLPGAGESITYSIGLAPGAQASVFGLQLEAQRAPGIYKPTTDRSGVYPNCRFDGGALRLTATGVNQNSALVRLVSPIPD